MESSRSRTHSGAPPPAIRYSRLYAAKGASPWAMAQSAYSSHGAPASDRRGGSDEASERNVSSSEGGTGATRSSTPRASKPSSPPREADYREAAVSPSGGRPLTLRHVLAAAF